MASTLVLFQLLLLLKHVLPPALLLSQNSRLLVFLALLSVIGVVPSWSRHFHHALLLTLVVATTLLRAQLLLSIFEILRLEVAFQLSELSLDLVLTVLADHLNRSQSLLRFPQFVLFLSGWTPIVL